MLIGFTIPGPLLPWKRTNTLQGRRVADAKQKAQQARIQMAWLSDNPSSIRKHWPKDKYYAVQIELRYPDRRVRDIDNCAKQILDALEGVAWNNDSRVWELEIVREIADEAQTKVFIHTMDEP